MRALVTLARRSALHSCMINARASKKKGGEVVMESEDIVNIFKDKTDPQLRPVEEYPLFVQELSIQENSFHQLMEGAQLQYRQAMPNSTNYKQFLKGLQRQRVKAHHYYLHMDRNPDIESEKFDINNRLVLKDVFAKDIDQIRAQEKAAEEEEDDSEEEIIG